MSTANKHNISMTCTMKFSLTFLSLSCVTMSSQAQVTPYRVSLKQLLVDGPVDQDSDLFNALTKIGMIAVSDLPMNFKDAKRTMTITQHECLMESKNTQEQIYPDGTVRVTLATHTVPGIDGKQALNHQTSNFDACNRFEAATEVVRDTAQVVVGAFTAKVSALLGLSDNSAFLVTEGTASSAPLSFNTFADIVENGEHLEHFHSYKKASKSVDQTSTIEMHTDQGLFLAFTPGRLTTGQLTTGFYIQTVQETIEEVHFTDADDLIFMLGDGVNQYINPKIQDLNVVLRAVPHAVKLESSEYARIWYGLMILPPAAAIHPAYGNITFGKLRQKLVAGDLAAIHLACPNSDLVSDNRMLQQCSAGELYCWHLCYNTAEFNVSEEICAAESRVLACISKNNEIWSGVTHGDYFPGCAGNDWKVEQVTSAPVLAGPMTPAPAISTTTRPPVIPPVRSPVKLPVRLPAKPPIRPPVKPTVRPTVHQPVKPPIRLTSAPIEPAPVRSAPTTTAIVTSAPSEPKPAIVAPIEFIPVISAPSALVTSAPVPPTPVESSTALFPLSPVKSAPISSTGSNSTNSVPSPTVDNFMDLFLGFTKTPSNATTTTPSASTDLDLDVEEVTPVPSSTSSPDISDTETSTPPMSTPGTSVPMTSAPSTTTSAKSDSITGTSVPMSSAPMTSSSVSSASAPSAPMTSALSSSDSVTCAIVSAAAIMPVLVFIFSNILCQHW